jgi:hypothetical protein
MQVRTKDGTTRIIMLILFETCYVDMSYLIGWIKTMVIYY